MMELPAVGGIIGVGAAPAVVEAAEVLVGCGAIIAFGADALSNNPWPPAVEKDFPVPILPLTASSLGGASPSSAIKDRYSSSILAFSFKLTVGGPPAPGRFILKNRKKSNKLVILMLNASCIHSGVLLGYSSTNLQSRPI